MTRIEELKIILLIKNDIINKRNFENIYNTK